MAKIIGVTKLASVITIEGRYNIKRFSPKTILSISYEDKKTGQEYNKEGYVTNESTLKELSYTYVITLYTLNVHGAICRLYLNKTGRKKKYSTIRVY